jgi:diacylglycerol kinase (ATP)
MRAILLHNKRSGRATPGGAYPKRLLRRLLQEAGYRVDYRSTRKPGWDEGLEDPGDLIAIAGGDGTVSKVLRRLTRRDVPLALLPTGASNNIAGSLGLTGRLETIIARLPGARRRRLDVGVARTAHGDRTFVESAGLGLFAEFLKRADPDEVAASGTDLLLQLVSRARSRWCRIKADGADLHGRYVLAMALNTPCVGPGLRLAPGAEPGDGKLDLLLVTPSQRGMLKEYLRGLADGAAPKFPFPLKQVRQIRMGWVVGAGHLDDRLWPNGQAARQGVMTLEVAAAPFEVLVP